MPRGGAPCRLRGDGQQAAWKDTRHLASLQGLLPPPHAVPLRQSETAARRPAAADGAALMGSHWSRTSVRTRASGKDLIDVAVLAAFPLVHEDGACLQNHGAHRDPHQLSDARGREEPELAQHCLLPLPTVLSRANQAGQRVGSQQVRERACPWRLRETGWVLACWHPELHAASLRRTRWATSVAVACAVDGLSSPPVEADTRRTNRAPPACAFVLLLFGALGPCLSRHFDHGRPTGQRVCRSAGILTHSPTTGRARVRSA